MKQLLSILLLGISAGRLHAQAPPDFSARCKEEMKKLSYLTGDWKGEAAYQSQKGSQTVNQTEHIEWKLQGLVLSIEGTGKQKNPATAKDEIVFQAFAIVNFDPFDQQFKFKSVVKEGYSSNAYFTVLQENSFEWGFDMPNGSGKSRYTILLDSNKKTWYEKGEYSRDGNTWMKFIELDLVKQ